ncbi:MAG TPA: hypothetical protein VFX49_10845 [Chloroflexota bacterium]|nr:hypothetical protein [Chloroflexota bacterium]
MQQQVQTHLTPEQVLSEASSFFVKRRAKVSERTPHGFSFALPGAEDGGRLSVAPGGGAGTTVTVEAEGLGVLAIAEGYVRELRKQSRSQGRSAGPSGGVALTDLRQRLGMPEPRPRQRPPAEPGTPGESSEVGGARPDGPTPNEAVTVAPDSGPKGGPAPRIEEGAADHRSTAETSGGVPAPHEVAMAAEPDRPNPGTPAGGAAGSEAPHTMGSEASEAPAEQQRLGA